MTDRINNLATLILRQRKAWFAVLPVLLLQVTLATHQFDHVADYVDSSCHVCVQLDRDDAAVDHSIDVALSLDPGFLISDEPITSVAQAAFRNFNSRAPPKI